jgi:asparagine synthase (glutamine-hydrolysing)
MDSSAIVCTADQLIAEGKAETPRLDTISYYDDDEPNWNDRPYFSLVESKRGREGYHIDVSATKGALLPVDSDVVFLLPGCDQLGWNRLQTFAQCLRSSQSRVLLSGIGGDEFLGGLPTPIPELQDLFAGFHWFRFVRQLFQFAVEQRLPLTHLAFNTIDAFLPHSLRHLAKQGRVAPWLTDSFVRRNTRVFSANSHRTQFFGPAPSFQGAVSTLSHLRRQLSLSHLSEISACRVSYPYFDRDLLRFLFATPREQLVRPAQRRSLMRRALAGIVPPDILGRKRKAFVARQPVLDSAMPNVKRLLQDSLMRTYDWIDEAVLVGKLESRRRGEGVNPISLTNTLKLALWLTPHPHHETLMHWLRNAALEPYPPHGRPGATFLQATLESPKLDDSFEIQPEKG